MKCFSATTAAIFSVLGIMWMFIGAVSLDYFLSFNRSLYVLLWQYMIEVLVIGALQEAFMMCLVFVDTGSDTMICKILFIIDILFFGFLHIGVWHKKRREALSRPKGFQVTEFICDESQEKYPALPTKNPEEAQVINDTTVIGILHTSIPEDDHIVSDGFKIKNDSTSSHQTEHSKPKGLEETQIVNGFLIRKSASSPLSL